MSDEKDQIPVERHGIAREFMDFIIHNKLWWMTPIIIVLALTKAAGGQSGSRGPSEAPCPTFSVRERCARARGIGHHLHVVTFLFSLDLTLCSGRSLSGGHYHTYRP